MELINATLRPGKVLEVLENGKIKASAPGLFSKKDSPDLLPPVYPFFGQHANSFSKPEIGDEIWILNTSDNSLQLHWFRKDNYIENNQEIFDETGTANVEILCNRETGMNWASLFFSDGTGWVLRNDDSKLQIKPDGSIELGMNWPHRTITIDPKAIHLGNGEQPAVLGNNLMDTLQRITATLELIQKAAMTNPFTAAIGAAITATLPGLKQSIPETVSTHVKLD